MFGDLDWPLNASRGFVSISWASCLPVRRSKHSTCYSNVGGWLASWVSVTSQYCIKTAKPILKLFQSPGSVFILVSSDPCTVIQFQVEPLHWGVK